MATGPEDALRSYLAAGDARHFDEFARMLDDDVVVHSPGGITSVGISAQAATWQAAHAGLGDLRHTVEQLLVAGDAVAARVTVSGDHIGAFLGIQPSGNRLQVPQALFARVDAGRIQELWEVVDTGNGLRQLGALAHQSLDLTRSPESDG